MLLECPLERRKAPVCGEAFYGGDFPPGGLADSGKAGADLAPVEEHGAGAAVACVAPDLGTGEAELVAQHVGEARCGRGGDADFPAIDRESGRRGAGEEFGARFVHAQAPARVRWTTVSAESRR